MHKLIGQVGQLRTQATKQLSDSLSKWAFNLPGSRGGGQLDSYKGMYLGT